MNVKALQELNSFTGTEQWYRHPLYRRFFYTDGIKHLIENADCYWLLDIIGSYQNYLQKYNDEMLRDMQFWYLKQYPKTGLEVKTKHRILIHDKALKTPEAYVLCERDSEDAAVIQEIPLTDFPFKVLPEVKIYVQRNTMEDGKDVMIACLPSEY